MAVYLFNIALIVFWRLFLPDRKIANPRKVFCCIAAFQWILVSGLRDWSIGADTYEYYLAFERVKSIPWSTLIENVTEYLFQGLKIKDPGYALLTKIFQIFFKDYQMFLVAIAVVFMVPMAMWIYKYSASPCTSFLIFSTLFYSFYAITGHRQTIATALIVFGGYEYIRNHKWVKFGVVSFVAYLIHKSSLVFVPFFFLTMISVTPKYKKICITAIAFISILGNRLYGPIASLIGYSDAQVNSTIGGADLYAALLVALSIITLYLHPRIKRYREDADFLYHATAITLLSALLVFQNQSFMRIQQYYSLFIMITVPEVLNSVKREHRLLAYLAFGLVMVLYIMSNDPYYQFFWTK